MRARHMHRHPSVLRLDASETSNKDMHTLGNHKGGGNRKLKNRPLY